MALLPWLQQFSQIRHKAPFNSLLSLLPLFIFLSDYLHTRRGKPKLPPSPPKLPIIGNLHQLGTLPHRSLQALSKMYGPLMFLYLGHVPALVLSSADMAREMLKAHDTNFSNRPHSVAANALLYGCTDISFAPYGEYWRQVRKLCVLGLLSPKSVQSFQHVREEEVEALIEKIRNLSLKEASINLSEMLLTTSNNIVSRCVFGHKLEGEDGKGRFGNLIRKDMFVAGTDTTSTTLEWLMAELIKNPNVMKRTQEEVRRVVGKKSKIEMDDISQMDYLKCVLKETLRLHPPAPLLLPRETFTSLKFGSYDIPPRTRVFVNAWAIQRDPNLWERPEEFLPERFEGNPIDYKGQDFEFLPFGGGRRGCPGSTFGMAATEYVIANILFWFDWKFPSDNVQDKDLDMSEVNELTIIKKIPLHLVPIVHNH